MKKQQNGSTLKKWEGVDYSVPPPIQMVLSAIYLYLIAKSCTINIYRDSTIQTPLPNSWSQRQTWFLASFPPNCVWPSTWPSKRHCCAGLQCCSGGQTFCLRVTWAPHYTDQFSLKCCQLNHWGVTHVFVGYAVLSYNAMEPVKMYK